MWTLRALNPQTERQLFHEAYQWRSSPRRHRMPFEEFAADTPTQIVLGLFNPALQAVYMFHQLSDGSFQAHFTSRRDADPVVVLLGAQRLVQWFTENNLRMVAYVSRRHIPLQRFVQQAGLVLQIETSQQAPIFAFQNTLADSERAALG